MSDKQIETTCPCCATRLVIDVRTWQRAESAAQGFQKQADVPIRGRRQRQDVYALPMQLDS